MDQLATVVTLFLYLLISALVLRAILSWWPRGQGNDVARLLHRVTEPLLEPVRRIMPRTGMIDLSTLVVTFLLYLMVLAVRQAANS